MGGGRILKKLLSTILLAILFLSLPAFIGGVRFPEEVTAKTVMEYLADVTAFYIKLIVMFLKSLFTKL